MLKVGTCGWSARGGRKAYFVYFKVIELQETFYKLPQEDLALKWREGAPADFEFTLKAWQAITHPISSPTWKRSGLKISKNVEEKYGYFRVTDETLDAWEKTSRICEILDAKVCIFQTPPSFGCTPENASSVEAFFTTINRKGISLGWEPRGNWNNNPNILKLLFEKLDLTHVVDPLKREPIHLAGFAYFRLHGIGSGEVNYRYKYTDEDLNKVTDIVIRYAEIVPTYVLFNNVHMFDDAVRLKKILQERCLNFI
ncbi:MAG: DUF72 domain-containing protein [Thermofilaceae archaeon]|nr:DUF72 domain-containing protein [Thermofilaceae archaeon]MCX8181159.1 DUF72 domain-containing protein [Thermofilaceae archaeon]MDW8004782.1 DUF72 domain-containing protein [Thermofilaceae archaeon]